MLFVGRRLDHGHRDRLWAACRKRWESMLGYHIYEGFHDEGPFSLSIATNRAAQEAGQWDTAIYVGGDWLAVTAEQVTLAVARSQRTGQLVFAHDTTVVLDRAATMSFLESGLVDLRNGDHHRNTFSGVVVFPRVLWDAVGGFDERFSGWGGEDLAFWCACSALAGGFGRVPGVIVHLWHERRHEDREGSELYPANDQLMRRYIDAKTSRSKTLQILCEPNGPLGPKEEK